MLKVSKILKASDLTDADVLRDIASWDSITGTKVSCPSVSVNSDFLLGTMFFHGIKNGVAVNEEIELGFFFDAHAEDAGFDHAFGYQQEYAVEVDSYELETPAPEDWPESLKKYRDFAISELCEYIETNAEID